MLHIKQLLDKLHVSGVWSGPEFSGSPLKSMPQAAGLKASPILSVGQWILNAFPWTKASSWEEQGMFPSTGLWWGHHFKMSLTSMSLSPSMLGRDFSLNFPCLSLKHPHSHKWSYWLTVGFNWRWKRWWYPFEENIASEVSEMRTISTLYYFIQFENTVTIVSSKSENWGKKKTYWIGGLC